MDAHWFDTLSKEILDKPYLRRSVVTALAGGVLALASGGPGDTSAKDKKSKKKPLQRNEYGCVAVGKACRGNDSVCCSGICEGKKPKKGERDRSQCEAHDTGGCVKGQQSGFCLAGSMGLPCTTSAGNTGTCETTTGNAGYCVHTGGCADCKTDSDCHATMGNPLAACIRCAYGCPQGTACVAPAH